jgi:hypothetical protein
MKPWLNAVMSTRKARSTYKTNKTQQRENKQKESNQSKKETTTNKQQNATTTNHSTSRWCLAPVGNRQHTLSALKDKPN